MTGASEWRWRQLAGPAVILVAAITAVGPLIVRGPSCGGDFFFHFYSWHDALSAWRQGILYPHWAYSANFGAGEPRFVFYPPLVWMLGALLGMILPWPLVPVVLSFLLLAATGLAVRALARQLLAEGAATLAGCTAIFSGFTVFETISHNDFAALAGGFWVPLLMLFLLRDRYPATSLWSRAFDGSALPLALVVAGAWLSNAPLGLMASYLLAFMALAAALLARSWAPIARAAVAGIAGMGLNAFYLIPATWEQRWVDVQQLFASPNHLIENRWIARACPGTSSPSESDCQGIFEAAMLALALGSLLAAWLLGKLPARQPASARRWWILLALIPFVVLFLLLPVSLPVWNLLPKLRYLEYPWRWLVVLEAPMAILFALAVWPVRLRLRICVVATCALVFVGIATVSGRHLFHPCSPGHPETLPVWEPNLALNPGGRGMRGTSEYTSPPGAQNKLIAIGLPDACLVSDPSTVLGKSSGEPDAAPVWEAAQGSCDETFAASPAQARNHAEHFEIVADTGQAGYLILRLRSYPAWRVMVNGRLIAGLPQRDDGLMGVTVPKGPVDLTVDWTTTPDVVAGRWLSGLFALLFAALFLLERRKNP